MIKTTLPTEAVKPLDEERLADLIGAAIIAAARGLAGTDVSGGHRLVYRANAGGFETVLLPAPIYKSAAIFARIEQVWQSAEAMALVNYLWERGYPQRTFTSEKSEATREVWSRSVWADLVHAPLATLLERRTARDLVRNGSYDAWLLDEEGAQAAAHELAHRHAMGRRRVQATCPALGLRCPDQGVVSLGDGVSATEWLLDEERLSFLTRHHRQYLDGDVATWGSLGVIRLELEVNAESPATASADVSRLLDWTKWALMVALETGEPFIECPVVIESTAGWRGATLRRGPDTSGGCRTPSMHLSSSKAAVARDLWAAGSQARASCPGLDRVIAMLGRACNAATARDALLDATIGLEILLVPGPGDSRYRFALHGAAMVPDGNRDDVHRALKKIYDLRSKAAHTAEGEERDFAALAPQARRMLAMATASAIALLATGELDGAIARDDVAKAIENLVRDRAAPRRS